MSPRRELRIRERRLRTPLSAMFLSILTGFILSTSARADDFIVNCSSATPLAYSSVNDALAALSPTGPHTITVTGTCRENVVIANRDRITILAPEGSTATIQPPTGGGGPAIRIADARGIVLERLDITGAGGQGIRLLQSSSVQVIDSTVESNQGAGIVVDGHSTLEVDTSSVRNNTGYGIRVRQSMVSIGEGVTIEGNGQSGLTLAGSQATLSASDHPIAIQSNGGAGVLVNYASSASFDSAILIQNNGNVGVQVFGGSAAVFTGSTDYTTTIQSNAAGGVALFQSSSGAFAGPIKILNNGGTNDPDQQNSGIYVSYGSSLYFFGTQPGPQVKDNRGPGILADPTGSMTLSYATITGNAVGGVVLQHESVARMFSGNTISGNSGAGVACDDTSLLYGDLTGISPIACKNATKVK